MAHNRCQPGRDARYLRSIVGGVLPDRQEYFLREVLSYAQVADEAIGQRIEQTAIALIEKVHGPDGPVSKGGDQALITWLVAMLEGSRADLLSHFIVSSMEA